MTDAAHAHEKWRAYPVTVLRFAEPHGVTIDLRQRVTDAQRRALSDGGWANAFAVFTAENPSGENSDDAPTASDQEARDARNASRRERLRAGVRARGIRMREVEASAPDGSYTEHCLAIDAALDEAVRLAREFDQLALFWYDGRIFWLAPAKAGERPIALPGSPPDE